MTKIRLIYNPYRVQTDLFIKNSIGNEERVSGFSKLNWISKRRLQSWINRSSNGYWKGFFYELSEISGDKGFSVDFIGTEDDFNDLKNAAKKFEDSCNGKVILSNINSDSQSSLTGKAKLDKLNKSVTKAKSSEFYNVFPTELRKYLNNGFAPQKAERRLYNITDMSKSDLELTFALDAWFSVCFCCDSNELNTERISAEIKPIVEKLHLLVNINAERERFSFVFFYDDGVYDHPAELGRLVKRFFLEQGIPEFPTYFVSKRYKNKLMNGSFDVNSSDEEIAKISADWSLYQRRYADQIRLNKSCGIIEGYIETYGLNKSSIRRSIDVSDMVRRSSSADISVSTENEALSRLYDLLNGWNFKTELSRIIGDIKTEFKKAYYGLIHKYDSPEYCVTHNNKRYIPEADLNRYLSRYKSIVRDLLQAETVKAFEVIERTWLSRFFEAFDEFADLLTREQSNWLPKSMKVQDDIIPPVSLLNRLKVYADNLELFGQSKYISNEKHFEETALLTLCNQQTEELFDEWLKKEYYALIKVADKTLKTISDRIKASEKKHTTKGTKNLYRSNIEKEARIKDEAVNWINDFIETITHLLDISASDNQ